MQSDPEIAAALAQVRTLGRMAEVQLRQEYMQFGNNDCLEPLVELLIEEAKIKRSHPDHTVNEFGKQFQTVYLSQGGWYIGVQKDGYIVVVDGGNLDAFKSFDDYHEAYTYALGDDSAFWTEIRRPEELQEFYREAFFRLQQREASSAQPKR